MTNKHDIQSLLHNTSLLIACAKMGAAQLILHKMLLKKKYDRPLHILLMKSVLATGLMLLMLAGYLAALSPLFIVDGRVAVDLSRRLMRPNSFSPLPRRLPLSFGLKCLVMRGPRSVNVQSGSVLRSSVASDPRETGSMTSIPVSMSLQCIHPYSIHLIAVVHRFSRLVLFRHLSQPPHLNNMPILCDSHLETPSLQMLHYLIPCFIFCIFLYHHIHNLIYCPNNLWLHPN